MSFKGLRKEKINLGGCRVERISPVIISASRATDIPAFFAEWFMNRLRAGCLLRANPFHAGQVQCISFALARVIVFWSKNPAPIVKYLPEINKMGLNYYFQFTLNDYEAEGLEPCLPPLAQRLETFKRLSDMLGKKRVIWRYDPLILADSIGLEELMGRVAAVGELVHDYTERLVVSFADIAKYRNVQRNLKRAGFRCREFTPDEMRAAAEYLHAMNRSWKLKIFTCAEKIDLVSCGIEHGSCIDGRLMAEIFGRDRSLLEFLGCQADMFSDAWLPELKDKGQRRECGCIVSKDIGSYDTCRHLCAYCYANSSRTAVESNLHRHRADAEFLLV